MKDESRIRLPITNIQRFSTHDGPGIRTTVFLKGCPLNCKWCHNPEAQTPLPQFFYTPSSCIGCKACEDVCPGKVHRLITGEHLVLRENCVGCLKCCDVCPSGALESAYRTLTLDEIISEVKKDEAFYGRDGGMTLSGGEPMYHGEGCVLLAEKAKEQGINVVMETCGSFDPRYLPRLKKSVALFLWDVKDTNPERHKANTGVDNGLILENLFALDRMGGKTILRCIMIKGINIDEGHLDALAKLFKSLKNCKEIQIFPYHQYGEGKYASLDKKYTLTKENIPDRSELKRIKQTLIEKGCKCVMT